jgi:ABC-type nitrate/sulfonate/bicarbonate transport system permease component
VVVATAGTRVAGDSAPSASGFTPGTLGASVAVLVVFLAVWEWLPRAAGVPEFILPPPSKVWSEFLRMLANDRLLWHTGITTLEIIVGFVLGCLLGIAIGFVLGSRRRPSWCCRPTSSHSKSRPRWRLLRCS